jgi:cell division protein ZapA
LRVRDRHFRRAAAFRSGAHIFMGQVAVTLNGRMYRLACGDGEEARLLELANVVKAKVEELTREFGQVGEARLLLMAALLVADELLDTRAALDAAVAEAAEALNMAAEAEASRVLAQAGAAAKADAAGEAAKRKV